VIYFFLALVGNATREFLPASESTGVKFTDAKKGPARVYQQSAGPAAETINSREAVPANT
jgi:hypothetical protein